MGKKKKVIAFILHSKLFLTSSALSVVKYYEFSLIYSKSEKSETYTKYWVLFQVR
jgi:hypothetical protein